MWVSDLHRSAGSARLFRVCRCVGHRLGKQKCGDRFRCLPHGVVGGRELVDLPLRIGLQSGAESDERRPVFPSRAVDELATRDPGIPAGQSDRLHHGSERMGTAAGISTVRRSDPIASGCGARSEQIPEVLVRR